MGTDLGVARAFPEDSICAADGHSLFRHNMAAEDSEIDWAFSLDLVLVGLFIDAL